MIFFYKGSKSKKIKKFCFLFFRCWGGGGDVGEGGFDVGGGGGRWWVRGAIVRDFL